MTEVVVRRIEQAWAVNVARADSQQRLSRALSAYETPLLFVDAGEEGRAPPQHWKVMYLNDSACSALGAPPVLWHIRKCGDDYMATCWRFAVC